MWLRSKWARVCVYSADLPNVRDENNFDTLWIIVYLVVFPRDVFVIQWRNSKELARFIRL